MIELKDLDEGTVEVECSECGETQEIPKMMLRELEGIELEEEI